MIDEFFEDAEIFVTGGSGVVGKGLIEKLLRSCNVRRIYILIRPKKNLNVEERLVKLKHDKIYARVLREKPDVWDKIVGINGDVTLPRLGICEEDLEKLKNVSVFYHSAATVRFDEPLKLAINLNVGGTYEALLLAETLKNLKMFMHVSTFYSNPHLRHIEPKVYPAPMDWKFALEKLRYCVDEDTLEALYRKITVGFPNTYTFTKNLAESLVNDFRHRVPVTIYRPSIVIMSLSEPEPGFPPALMGALGLFTLAACGLLKAVYAADHVQLDLTPIDICAKTMIYFTVKARRSYENGTPDEAPVFLMSSYGFIKSTFKQLCQFLQKNSLWFRYAVEKNILIPGCILTESHFRYMLHVYFQQIPAALLGNAVLCLMGKEPLVLSMVRRCFITLQVMDPFRLNHYTSEAIPDLQQMFDETDGTEFASRDDFELTKDDKGMLRIMTNMVIKIREHLLKEDPKTTKRSSRIVRGKVTVYNIFRAIMAYYLIVWLYQRYLS